MRKRLQVLLEGNHGDFARASGVFSNYGYIAVFLVLVACGFGVPIPEDITQFLVVLSVENLPQGLSTFT